MVVAPSKLTGAARLQKYTPQMAAAESKSDTEFGLTPLALHSEASQPDILH